MDELEIDRMSLELIKVAAARAEQEFMIKQRLSEIKRIKANIEIQLAKEAELKQKIEDAQK